MVSMLFLIKGLRTRTIFITEVFPLVGRNNLVKQVPIHHLLTQLQRKKKIENNFLTLSLVNT